MSLPERMLFKKRKTNRAPKGKARKTEIKKRPLLIVGFGFTILLAALLFTQTNVSGEDSLVSETEDSSFVQAEKDFLKDIQESQGASSAQVREAERLLNNAFGDGKITVSTQRREEPLTNCIRDYLEAEKEKRESVLLYQGYLGLFGNSWGCLMKDPGGVTLSIFSEKEDATVQDEYRLLQEVWDSAAT